jgi:hypothetical protein
LGWLAGRLVGCGKHEEAGFNMRVNKLNFFELRPDMPNWILGPQGSALRGGYCYIP